MKNRFLQLACIIAVLVVLCVGISLTQTRMNGIRYESRLTDAEPLENAPPVVAFTTMALGGFRGLLADYLWLRSTKMQEDSNYFEMVQLADWIVKLQPRYSPSTCHLAWNMAYNISVTFTRFEDRWRWVKRGIELIRDEAMKYNPSDPALFQQLGWIYQHKMGQDLDDANKFYKDEFAKEMIRLFGPYYGKWDVLGKAPDNEAKLRAALGNKAFARLQVLMANNSVDSFKTLEENFRTYACVFPLELRTSLKEEGMLEIVELCLRARWITQKYRLDPLWIKKLNQEFGEFDWRLPEVHAIYWATRGKSGWNASKSGQKKQNILQCDRMITQSLQNAFIAGKLVYISNKEDETKMYENILHIELKPNLELAEAAQKAYAAGVEEYGVRVMGPGYMNFLCRAIGELYINGKIELAKKFMEIGRNVKDPDGKPHYGTKFDGDVRSFARREIAASLVNPSNKDANAIVRAFIFQGLLEFSLGDEEQDRIGNNYIHEAKVAYRNYRLFVKGTELRRDMPPWDSIVNSTLAQTLFILENPATAPTTQQEFEVFLNTLKNPRAIILRDRFQKNAEAATKVFLPPAEDIKESEIK